ncbi:MAG: transporter substrate-binding domain-containing protein [Prevotella sp.]|nr:transporter substrate-binding domain-containing protein [Prevotella sp.]
MNKKIITLAIACLIALCHAQYAKAEADADHQQDHLQRYTKEKPLVIVSDWEFPPYEFRNDLGEPDGYNVEVLNIILNKLGVPHRFLMQEWYKCTETFENRQADLIHALKSNYEKAPYEFTHNMITYYNVRAVRLRGTRPLNKIGQLLAGDTLGLKKNDYMALKISERPDNEFAIEYLSPREALMAIRSGKLKYYAWGEHPLKMKVKELGLEGIEFDETDIPSGELRIIGYDKDLLEDIDDMFARLEQSGDIQRIHDKWFHPDQVHNDASPVALILLIVFIVIALVTLLFSHLMRIRVRKAVEKSLDMNQMMTEALKSGNYYVLEHDFKTDHIRNVYGELLPKEGASSEGFKERLPSDERSMYDDVVQMISSGQKDLGHIKRRFNKGTAQNPDWRWLDGHAVVEFEDGKPRFALTSFRDYTHEIMEERINEEISSKYQNMFSRGLVAMSFYNKDGDLIDVNRRMAQLCEFDKEGEKYFRQVNLFEVPLVKGQFRQGDRENFHVCQRMFYPELGIYKYIELKVRPTFDEKGELQFYVVTGRDLTAERKMYIEQHKHDREIAKATEEIKNYEEQLGYLLENSNMYEWSYNLAEGIIHFSRSGRRSDYTETIEEFFAGATDEFQEKGKQEIRDCIAQAKPYNTIIHFNFTPSEPHPVWYAISGIPTLDESGHVIEYFGISRNITNLMEAQQRLKDETQRAEESGKMKAAFLANMTHEIRTPLNAIVGFSDLLPMVDSHDDRMEFIRIIRNNCDMLMRLINDILEASNLGQSLAIKPEEVDFAKVFDDICQSLAQRVDEAGVEFIKDNPYDSFIATLDKGRIQQVLTNFTTNATKYTHQGHIKLGYREQDGGIYFYCEDTGAGIPKDKQAAVFERFVKLNDFVQGTGLGLSICKAIADSCNGKIGVTSEGEGHGSTFWMWIPQE